MEELKKAKSFLRKISYRLSLEDGFIPDAPREDEVLYGLFHGWCERPAKSPYDDSYYTDKSAIIEDIDTGKINCIPVDFVIGFED